MTTHHPIPPADLHRSILWLRSLEIVTGMAPVLLMSRLLEDEMFKAYRSPWRA